MRGHDTYFPAVWEIGIMFPYSAVCLERFPHSGSPVQALALGNFSMGCSRALDKISAVSRLVFCVFAHWARCSFRSGGNACTRYTELKSD